MSRELVDRITVKKDGVYISTHSSNDTAPFHSVKSLFLTEAFNKEGRSGLDSAIISMCLDNWDLYGNHQSIIDYKDAINKAIYEKDFINIRNQYDELSDKAFDIVNGFGEYKNISKEKRSKLYTEIKPQIEELKDKRIKYITNIVKEIRNSKEENIDPSKSYKVTVTETLERVVEVEAESAQDAIYKVQEMYDNSEIVLDETDYQGVDINASYIEYAKDAKNIDNELSLRELQDLLDGKDVVEEIDKDI